MKHLTCTTTLLFASALASSAVTADFSDVSLARDTYTIGDDVGVTIASKGMEFSVSNFDGYWVGIGCASFATERPSAEEYGSDYFFIGQYKTSATVGSAQKYGVVYYGEYFGPDYIPTVTFPDGLTCPESITIANSSYTWASMKYGDGFAKKFGAGDWYLLTISGLDAAGNSTGTVEVYLADNRAADESAWVRVDDWTKVDLTGLGTNVKSLTFALSSSDTGNWGMNTPSYFNIASVEAYGTYLWPVVGAWDDSWYGEVYAHGNSADWVYSRYNASWQYAVGNADGSAYFYDPLLGWSYTDHSLFPYVYLFNLGGWVWTYDANRDAANRWFCLLDNSLAGSFADYPYATAAEIAAFASHQ